MTPSYPIVFYVSGHGFGHASRSIEVIRAVLRLRPDAGIVVKSSAPKGLFEESLGPQVAFVEMVCDTGMTQIDSLNVDPADSVRQAKAFQERVPGLAAEEASYLQAHASHVVVGDIPPLAFASAARVGLPSIAIGNFTWDWIYEAYPEESPWELVRQIRSTCRQATEVLRLPLAGGFAELEATTHDIPFIARPSRRHPDEVRRALGLPPRASARPLVLLSLGGYGVEGLDTAALGALRDYTVVTTNLPTRAHHIRPAPGLLCVPERQLHAEGLRYEDLVRAADVVVTKPGYGIISDAIANDAALLYTSRGRFAEYEVLVRDMPRYVRARFIEQEDLLKGRWAEGLEQLLTQPPPPERPSLDGAEVAARRIAAYLEF